MNVYVANAPQRQGADESAPVSGYCGVTSCVLEGLNQLGMGVRVAHRGLHADIVRPLSDEYDLYIVQRTMHYDHSKLLRQLEAWNRLKHTAFIDGFDYVYGPDYFWLESGATYFQKENLHGLDVHTLPFGIENRFIGPRSDARQGEASRKVMLAYRHETHPDREAIRHRLVKAGLDVVVEHFEDAPEQRGPAYWQTGGRHNRAYYSALDQCRVGVAMEGEAVDTLRYWEFAASFAVLVSPPVERIISNFPDPPTPDMHYISYESPDDVVDAVREAMDRYKEITSAQRAFYLSHHRSVHRAARVLSVMGFDVESRAGQGECCRVV